MTTIGHSGQHGLDRAFQLRLLEQLRHYHPHSHVGRWQELDSDENKVKGTLFYLREHGLIETDAQVEKRFGGGFAYSSSRITAKGLDFLEDDGGISAILGVQVVKLHDETIRELIIQRVMQADLAPPEKRRLIDGLRELRGESIKHLTMKLLDAGLDNGPDALRWIATFLSQ